MPAFVDKAQNWLSGKKTYLTAAIGLLTAVAAFADHQIDLTGLLAAVWAAVQACNLRSALAKAAQQ